MDMEKLTNWTARGCKKTNMMDMDMEKLIGRRRWIGTASGVLRREPGWARPGIRQEAGEGARKGDIGWTGGVEPVFFLSGWWSRVVHRITGAVGQCGAGRELQIDLFLSSVCLIRERCACNNGRDCTIREKIRTEIFGSWAAPDVLKK
jgi:hypothetical protein